MKTINKTRKISTLAILSVVGCIAVGAFGVTLAMLRTDAAPATNRFAGAAVNIGVVENGQTIETGGDNTYTKVTSGTPITKQVAITNIDSITYPTTDTYVRVRLVPSFRYDSGDQAGQLVPVDIAGKVTYVYGSESQDWKTQQVAGETYYYYTKALAPDETSKDLLRAVTYTGTVPENTHFELQVLTEGIAANQNGALLDVWGLSDFDSLDSL